MYIYDCASLPAVVTLLRNHIKALIISIKRERRGESVRERERERERERDVPTTCLVMWCSQLIPVGHREVCTTASQPHGNRSVSELT